MFPQIDAMSNPTNLSLVTLTGTVIGSWNLGCLAGAVFTFFLCNILGRKYCIVVGLGVEIIGKIIQCSSFTLGQYIAGRVVSGVGNGFIASSVPAWQAECLKTQRRGTILLVSFGGCITLGIALSYWISYGFSWIHTLSVSWRFPVAFSILILTPALIMIAFLPESPRYLLLCGKEKEALHVLSALEELPPDHEDVRREVLLIKNTVLRLASGSSFSGMFSMGKERNLHRVLLAGKCYHQTARLLRFSLLLIKNPSHAATFPAVHWYQPLHSIPWLHVRKPAWLSGSDRPPSVGLLRNVVLHHINDFRHRHRPLLWSSYSDDLWC